MAVLYFDTRALVKRYVAEVGSRMGPPCGGVSSPPCKENKAHFFLYSAHGRYVSPTWGAALFYDANRAST
jgi:hypothetical protein